LIVVALQETEYLDLSWEEVFDFEDSEPVVYIHLDLFLPEVVLEYCDIRPGTWDWCADLDFVKGPGRKCFCFQDMRRIQKDRGWPVDLAQCLVAMRNDILLYLAVAEDPVVVYGEA
jgi:hypothetical protein